jgi:hypothetical protein
MTLVSSFRAFVLSFGVAILSLFAATHTSAETFEFHYAPGIVGDPLTQQEVMDLEEFLEANAPSLAQSAVFSQQDEDAMLQNSLQYTPSTGAAVVEEEVHGCHKRRCYRTCPICTFPRSTDTKGHCKKGGLLHSCFRR